MTLTPTDIVRHIKTYIPLFTDKFSEIIPISSASISVGNVLTITSIAHGKNTGQYVLINAGKVRNAIIVSSLIDATVRFTTTYDHDLTKPTLANDDYYLTLNGFGNVWDGTHEIIEVPNRKNFEIYLPDGETTAPIVDGSQYLLESIPQGIFQIASTPDDDTITIEFPSARDLPIGAVNDLEIIDGFRICAAADYNRAREVYNRQETNKAYLFVIMTDVDVAKDRNVLNDSIAELTRKDLMLLRLLQSFSTTVFLPATDDISGADVQQLAYDEIFNALLRTIFGFAIDGGMFKSVIVPSSMGPGEYNSAFYVHVYDWQLSYIINFEDGMPIPPDRAFRDIDAYNLIGGDDTENMTTLPNDLDEEPL